ncbi:pilus assembly protein PilZ [Stenotrophomonas maltophilia]|jgi:c-di-GMP-binding flagellar brake protein YcgR|uniref:flagellar brake protein n=1 Tax=Stenotrophomonas TaxID=40323 RepID=UPI000DA9040D|nr:MULTISPECIES: flagellar brake protein [Stenotrophomonas]MBE5272263.1 flagellar brake protein [Stenotrophomonas sp. B2]MBH1666805.1 flagellar brake protein [Stenotrophomonas maltophilia]MCU1023019.1 flagellar brake protein [Stenotrophomonas maltophilia]MDH2023662.1 flagellar brake protein [Stenotrophomonas sp. GD03680]MDI9250220.1 flagellar brake protein [Stenotrophomonas sp. RS-48]
MSDGNDTAVHDVHAADAADERFLVRNPRQLRQLLRSLIEQRSLINAHIDGRDRSFPTALLELDEDEDVLLIDGSPQEASNRAAEQADHVLCFAQLERVLVRFRLQGLQRVDNDGHVAFRAALPEELMHLQRRELYRLETPVTDSPQLLLPAADGRPEALSMRVVDISGGGLAVAVPSDCAVFGLQQRYAAVLSLSDGPDLDIELVVCNLLPQRQPNGTEIKRVGMRFDSLPRGGDSAIQRYIFRIDRQRKARRNGEM